MDGQHMAMWPERLGQQQLQALFQPGQDVHLGKQARQTAATDNFVQF